jgi:hypothetical protein
LVFFFVFFVVCLACAFSRPCESSSIVRVVGIAAIASTCAFVVSRFFGRFAFFTVLRSTSAPVASVVASRPGSPSSFPDDFRFFFPDLLIPPRRSRATRR